MANQIPVQFHGEGSGVGPLTWGQRGVWRAIVRQGSSEFMGGVFPMPDGITAEDLADALRYIIGRHQSLRTRLVFDQTGDPSQRVFESGELSLEVVDAGDDDVTKVAEDLRRRYESVDFNYTDEWPVRMAAVRQRVGPVYLVAVYNHLAVDAHALLALVDDLFSRDPVTGAPVGPVTAMQPLEQARLQQLPSAQRQTDGALRHWERVLRSVPAQRFGESNDERDPRWWDATYFSPAAYLAMRSIAASLGTDTSPVLLAGFAVAMASTVGRNPVVLQIAVSNRFRPGFAASVSPLAQASPCYLDVADITFAEAVTRAYRAAMTTYLHSYYDPVQRFNLTEAINEERGEVIDVQCYFNDRRDAARDQSPGDVPTTAEIEAALSKSKLTWGPYTAVPEPTFYLDIDDADGGVEFQLTVDTHYVGPPGMEAFVRALETVLVEAAKDTSKPTGVRA